MNPQTATLEAYSYTEFAFTVAYSVDGEWLDEEMSCAVVVRNEKHMILAKRRYVLIHKLCSLFLRTGTLNCYGNYLTTIH